MSAVGDINLGAQLTAVAAPSTDRLMPTSVRRRPRSNRPGDAATAAFANA
jgi:hypothetical protein